MKLQLIRNATMRITYAGQTILTDPCLAAAGALPSYAGRAPNPTVSLPIAIDDLLATIDLVLVSHLHKDHFDPTAQERIPEDTKILCRSQDADQLNKDNFSQVQSIENHLDYKGIEYHSVPGRHGTSQDVLGDMGTTCGFVLRADNEPTLYWAGDTVWYEGVRETISKWNPDIILTHSGGAVWNKDELIIMDAKQTVDLCRFAPASQVVAIHMEAFDHCTITRAQMRRVAREAGISDDRLLIPEDGEEIVIGGR